MKASELRIGNLIIVDNFEYHPNLKDIPLSVTGINPTQYIDKESTHAIGLEHISQDKNKYYESYSQFIEYIKPIPLTEEWLIKFGFDDYNKQDLDAYPYELNDFQIEYDELNKFHYLWVNDDRIKIEYVHQLQNIYFALTGEELKILSRL